MKAIFNFFEFIQHDYKECSELTYLRESVIHQDRLDAFYQYHNYLLLFGISNDFAEYGKQLSELIADNIEADPAAANQAVNDFVKNVQRLSKDFVNEFDVEL